MANLIRHPVFVSLCAFIALWLSARVGAFFRARQPEMLEDVHEDLGVISAATLTLLGLIIGFTFSMAISRYDQRKNYEEQEANAIGTEYVRADLLPPSDAVKIRAMLKMYLGQRILFYQTKDEQHLREIDAYTAILQGQMWSAVEAPATADPTPVRALAVSGMNDVLNSQGYTQAAWWNRIPTAAWGLMLGIAICSNILVSYSRRRPDAGIVRFMALPFILSIAFFAIADIDTPRRGVIRVVPQNLISLSESLQGH
jgi:hypothetical protein